MRMSLSRRDGLFGDPGADTVHGRGQREHVTCDIVSCQYYYLDLQYQKYLCISIYLHYTEH